MKYFLIPRLFSIQNSSLPILKSENIWLCIGMSTTDAFISLPHHVELYDDPYSLIIFKDLIRTAQ